jgi:hypothetical protein
VQAQFASLAGLLNSVLVLILILGGAFDLYLVRQVKTMRTELTAMRTYVGQTARNSAAIDEFARKLTEYGKTHADFAPIVNKYGLKATAVTNVGPAGSAPAPASAPKATKK